MILSHKRRFVLFPDPIDGSPALSRGFAPLDEIADLCADRTNRFFHAQMAPCEAEWAFDASGLVFQNYLRVAVVQNPFARMVRLYERIAQSDPLWKARNAAGLGRPDFYRWLRATRPYGFGAGGKHSAPWRRFGAWSARNWCGDYITHTIRQEAVAEDLPAILSILGVAPAFDRDFEKPTVADNWEHYYDARAIALMHDRYGWDLAQYGYSQPRQLRAS